MEDKAQKFIKWEANRLIIVPIWFIASTAYYLGLLYKVPNTFKILTLNDVLYNNYLFVPLLVWCTLFFIIGLYKDNLFRILSFLLLTVFLCVLGGYCHYVHLSKSHRSNVLVNMLSQDSHNVQILATLENGLLIRRLDSHELRLIAWNAIESVDYKISDK